MIDIIILNTVCNTAILGMLGLITVGIILLSARVGVWD